MDLLENPPLPEGRAILQPALAQLLVQLNRVARHRGWWKRMGQGQMAGFKIMCRRNWWEQQPQHPASIVADADACTGERTRASSAQPLLTTDTLRVDGALRQPLVQLVNALLLCLQAATGQLGVSCFASLAATPLKQ